MLWGTYLLDNEVANGGLEQYFFNSSRYYTAEALDGLVLLAADEHEILLREAIGAASAGTWPSMILAGAHDTVRCRSPR
jgi:hypothetical protein